MFTLVIASLVFFGAECDLFALGGILGTNVYVNSGISGVRSI